jgi:hypothetical protein
MYEIASGTLRINRDLCYLETFQFVPDTVTILSPIIYPVTVIRKDHCIQVPDFNRPLYEDMIHKEVICSVDIIEKGEFVLKSNKEVQFLNKKEMSYYQLSTPQMVDKLRSAFKYYANVKK